MAAERDVEEPLSQEDVRKILRICSPKGLLVGGQALAFWADHLGVELPRELSPVVTADADFIGNSGLAKELGRRLGWKTWIPSLDDATPQTGKVTQRARGGGTKQVDFLSGVVGLTTKDVMRRAAELHVPTIGLVRVMHPIDVLDSRIQNLHLVPGKRNRFGVAQAKLAVGVARAFIQSVVLTQDERAGLKLLERVVEIAEDIAAVHVFLLYGIDPLAAVPLANFRLTSRLHTLRWPAIQRKVAALRATAKKLTGRAKSR